MLPDKREMLKAAGSPQILKGIVGQCAFQLLVMYALVFHMDVVFQVPATDTSNLHSSIIFNTFVLMQLVNQVGPTRREWNGDKVRFCQTAQTLPAPGLSATVDPRT